MLRRRTTTVLVFFFSLGAALLGAASVGLPGSGSCCAQPGQEGAPCESMSPTTCCEATGAVAQGESGSTLLQLSGSRTSSPLRVALQPFSCVESSLAPHERLALATIVLRL